MKHLFRKITAIALSATLLMCSFCFISAGATENAEAKPFVVKATSNIFPGSESSYYDISQFEDDNGDVFITVEYKLQANAMYILNLDLDELTWDKNVLEFKEDYNKILVGRTPRLNVFPFGIEQGLGGGMVNTFGDKNGGRIVGNYTSVSPAAYAYNEDGSAITVVKAVFKLLDKDAKETTVNCVMDTITLCDETIAEPYSQYYLIRSCSINEESSGLATLSTAISPAAQYKTGDLDSDGEVSVNDVTELQRILAEFDGLDLTDPAVFAAADLNKDGKVNIRDVTYGQRYLAGFITEL